MNKILAILTMTIMSSINALANGQILMDFSTSKFPAPLEIKSSFTAKAIYILKELGRVEISEPSLVFEKDIGYGLNAYPLFMAGEPDDRKLGNFICQKLGFGSFVTAEKSKLFPEKTYYFYVGGSTTETIYFREWAGSIYINVSCDLK